MIKSYEDTFVEPTGSINIFAGWDKGDIELVCLFRPSHKSKLMPSYGTTLARHLLCLKTLVLIALPKSF